jgi:hypothetical protein
MMLGKWNFRVNTDCKLLVETGFIGSRAVSTAVVLRPEIEDTLCICVRFLCTGFEGSLYMSVSVHLVCVHCIQ